AVILAHDSWLPRGGSYLAMDRTSSMYSLVWDWSLSQGGASDSNSWLIWELNDSGPLASFTMISWTGDGGPLGGGPLPVWLVSVDLLQAARASITASKVVCARMRFSNLPITFLS